MARVSTLLSNQLPQGPARTIFEKVENEYGAFGNMLGVLAHRPASIEHIYGLLLQFAAEGNISKLHLEIVLVTASKANECSYCVSHHAPKLVAQHVSAETVERILDADVPGLGPVELLVRDYALAVTRQRVGDSLVTRLREHFSESQIVELTLRAALCAFFARFNEALDVQLEPEYVTADAA
ncbi:MULTISPECIES: carboxymuconolactone decarboxylase family protein [unclassified Herbaspirillum]|uniref:carboxymuconolactone decarboxylase family protein n=1 Tax=unclassified Herbaspirillum TaxID=2624150 RepID=UPI000E2F5DFF|nr:MULTISPECIES: carboxymuconolactone decarboxylase family protein [unclassified Herbaspirillum]RFB67501.1 carboxymuconolactone decarboxylase family protein [Herbaspirillum sp. 3R-3a1]TFI05107.1 carboxymuconolactone decarboxylase family protein [Herbaspirillum sp. 3R11]TFI12563.1 carboxymuconolactone decarboxylase family protein [Herbaspirillum sp. 3R-11]TFI21062.1 carboxymuconolactone decarboxylase family protein [Herbaspirillum sp. 3C11]